MADNQTRRTIVEAQVDLNNNKPAAQQAEEVLKTAQLAAKEAAKKNDSCPPGSST